MDLSKLPKLSKSDPPPPVATEESIAESEGKEGESAKRPSPGEGFCTQCGAALVAGHRFCGKCGTPVRETAPVSSGADAWISIAVGVILALIYPYFGQWLYSLVNPAYQPPFLPIKLGETVIPYPQSDFFVDHLAVFLFALVLIGEGIVLAFWRRPLIVMLALLLTWAAVALNLLNIIQFMSKGYAFPYLSGMAVAFGVYIAIYQMAMYRSFPKKRT